MQGKIGLLGSCSSLDWTLMAAKTHLSAFKNSHMLVKVSDTFKNHSRSFSWSAKYRLVSLSSDACWSLYWSHRVVTVTQETVVRSNKTILVNKFVYLKDCLKIRWKHNLKLQKCHFLNRILYTNYILQSLQYIQENYSYERAKDF